MTSNTDCPVLYWRLLELTEKNPINEIHGIEYSELMKDTFQCDKTHKNFTNARNDLQLFINEVHKHDDFQYHRKYYNIVTKREERIARQALYHFRFEHKLRLRSSLTWQQWTYYWAWYKPTSSVRPFVTKLFTKNE